MPLVFGENVSFRYPRNSLGGILPRNEEDESMHEV